MLKESASPLLPLRGGSYSNAMFPPGTAVGPKPPRTAPAFLRRAGTIPQIPRTAVLSSVPAASFLLAVVRPAACFRSSPPCSSSPSARAPPRGSPSPLQSRLFALRFPSPASLTHPLGSANLLRPAPLPFSLAPYSLAPASHAPESCPAPTDAPPVLALPSEQFRSSPALPSHIPVPLVKKYAFPAKSQTFFPAFARLPLTSLRRRATFFLN